MISFGLSAGPNMGLGGSGRGSKETGAGTLSVAGGLNYFAADGNTSPVYNGPTWPSAVYFADTNTTWFAYEGKRAFDGTRMPKCTTFNHTTRIWTPPTPIGIATLVDDSHGVPSLCRDDSGYVYCFYGAHVAPQSISSTLNPNDPTVWLARTALGTTLSYPHCHNVGGTFYLFNRQDSDLNERTLNLYKSTSLTAGVPAWGAAATNLVDFDPDSRFYQYIELILGTDILICANRADADDITRQHLYLFRYETTTGDIGNFEDTFSVNVASRPMTYAQANTNCRLYTHAAGHYGSYCSMALDTNSHPHLVVVDGTQADRADALYQGAGGTIYHIWHNGTSWQAPVDTGLKVPGGSSYVSSLVAEAAGVIRLVYAPDSTSLWTATRSAAGVWSTGTPLVSSGNAFVGGAIKDGIAEARFTINDTAVGAPLDASGGSQKMYAYGSNGFLQRASVPYYTWINSEGAAYNARRATPLNYADSYYVDTLFTAIKAVGLTKFDAFYVASSNEADSLLNLISSSYPLVKVGTAPFVAYKGWTGDGSTGYLDTQYTPSTSGGAMTQNSAHIGVWTRVVNDNDLNIIGASDGTRRIDIVARTAGDLAAFRVNDGTQVTVANTTSAGYYVANRSASNAKQLYKNGASLTTGATVSTGLPTVSIHFIGTAAAFSNNQGWAAHLGSSLTSTEVSNLYANGLRPLARIWGVA